MCFLKYYNRSSGQYIIKTKVASTVVLMPFKEKISSNPFWDSKKAHFLSIIWGFLSLKATEMNIFSKSYR